MSYSFLQHYWWFLIALLAGILVAMMFVQGANSLIFSVTMNEREKRLLINSTGRKWELTFTTLVVFGGAFFAAFPLFYSTSFSGAYWIWMILLFTFILQAISYEYQSKLGNILGGKVYRIFLLINGILAPFLVGTIVASFFNGSNFSINFSYITSDASIPFISHWGSEWHGLELLINCWNYILGFALFFLARVLGSLYLIRNIDEVHFIGRIRGQIMRDMIPFLLFFILFILHIFSMKGATVDATTNIVYLESQKYLQNLLHNPLTLSLFTIGLAGILYGIIKSIISNTFTNGFWFSASGSIFVVIALFLLCGYNGTAYYPSNIDLQSSLTISNSCSSEFTLRAMAWISLLIPFVVAYIAYVWHAMDKKPLTHEEIDNTSHKY